MGPKPSLGRIVLAKDGRGNDCPAIICAVHSSETCVSVWTNYNDGDGKPSGGTSAGIGVSEPSGALGSVHRECSRRYRGGFDSSPVPTRPGARLLIALALVAAAALALAGCVSPVAIRQAQENAAINRAHEIDQALPPQARAIAQDNADAWEAQLYSLDGTKPSAAALARIEARKVAATKAPK